MGTIKIWLWLENERQTSEIPWQSNNAQCASNTNYAKFKNVYFDFKSIEILVIKLNWLICE